ATLFMCVLAGLQVMLGRYAGQQDVAVGTPVANRSQGLDRLIGFFVNTLVLRTELGGNPSFAELLARVRRMALAAYQHQEVPFEKLVDELQLERDLSRSPLVQVVLAFQPLPGKAVAFGNITFDFPVVDTGIAKFDLTVRVVHSNGDTKGDLQGLIEYSQSIFEPATVEGMARHLRMVLEQMVARPEQKIGELSLLTGDEREQVLVEWNRTEADYPQRCVHELFERQVARTPNAPAVEHDGEQISYAVLDRRANQLAHYLRKRGVGPEVTVGVCLHRGVELVVALMGVLKAGGAYVPLDPEYPRERLQFMTADARAAVLLTESDLRGLLGEGHAQVICVDEQQEEIAAESTEAVSSGVVPQNLAYLIYTSGSTGRPKGIAIAHQSTNVLLHWVREMFTHEELEGVLASTSVCFDVSIFELFAPLSWGGKLIIVANALALPQLAETGKIKIVSTVPSAMAELVRMRGVPSSVRVVNLGGEAVPRSLVQQIYEHTQVERVLNMYGPSEDTTYSTCAFLTKEDAARTMSIGRQVSNTQAYVLDENFQPLPARVPGELYLGGAGLARGYLNRPDMTAKKFLPNPFSATGGERLYRTGDRARWRSDGELEYLGRFDHQIKVRGYRIELGEIESVLLAEPHVAGAVVVARGEGANQRLVAYVAGEDRNAALDTAPLRERLRELLPEYMQPSMIVPLPEIPLTPNGKVDRSALPELGYQEGDASEDRAARTPEEEILAGIFARVLEVERVGVRQNFFEIGGHSLLATQATSRVRSAFGIDLPLRTLFESPTVEKLAQVVGRARAVAAAEAPLVRVSRDGRLPLSYAQQRLWFLQQMDPQSAAYNMPFAWRLSGNLDRQALQQSLNALAQRHEGLRTSFRLIDGDAILQIAGSVELPIRETDLRSLPAAEREAEARRLAHVEAATPFDLRYPPLLRVGLLRLDEHEYVLMGAMHHVISDGWSVQIMLREISRFYEACIRDMQPALEELKIQYVDYAVWQRQWLQGEVLERQLQYWRQQLAGLEPLDLPTDHARPAVMNQQGASVPFLLPEELSDQIQELGRSAGTTLFMTLLAAWQTVLSKYSGQRDIAVGTVVANRNRVEIEELIGFFVNTLVLRTQCQGNPDFVELLDHVRRVTLDAYQHQEMPFEKLVEELQPERDLGRSPLFQVMLLMGNTGEPEFHLPRLRLSQFTAESDTTKFDLSLAIHEDGGRIAGALSYASDLFEKQTAQRLLDHLRLVLERMVAVPASKIEELVLLTAQEREQVLVEWNRTAVENPRRPLHQMFEAQAVATPQALAVEFEGQRMSYAELNRRANQLAQYIRKMGVGPEVKVGICMHRSPRMIVALLSVLKASGAYVPLDAEYPPERLQFMMEDSEAAVLLTESGMSAKLPPTSARRVLLDHDWEVIAGESNENLPVTQHDDNLAYVIYTSGSTGRPKGVGVAMRGLVNLVHWHFRRYQFGRDDRMA
ncbi:MAG: amino acid adenylation domain-containing protein, partial [Acidobacteriia bacterium]|nr:amino acid adenylation domain-containing protein [Terriglobia bacterium]